MVIVTPKGKDAEDVTFIVEKETKIMKGGKVVAVKDVMEAETVTVTYAESRRQEDREVGHEQGRAGRRQEVTTHQDCDAPGVEPLRGRADVPRLPGSLPAAPAPGSATYHRHHPSIRRRASRAPWRGSPPASPARG